MIKEIIVIETSPCMAEKSKLKGITEADLDLTELLPVYKCGKLSIRIIKPALFLSKRALSGSR